MKPCRIRVFGRDRRKRVDAVTISERQQSIRAMSRVQRDAFLTAAQGQPIEYFVLFVVLVRAGLRPGEAYALEVEDVDLAARKIHVNKALSLQAVGPTKTGRSRRVDASKESVAVLRDFLVWREKETLRHGWRKMPSTLFFNEQGSPLDESRVRKCFARALKMAELSGFRVYDCRHTYASLLLNAGAPITYVAAQLGHTKPTTTLQWYAHFLPSSDDHRFVDGLDGDGGNLWHQFGTKLRSSDGLGKDRKKKAPVSKGFLSGPRVTRTLDPLIKSQLL
jgi:integrase